MQTKIMKLVKTELNDGWTAYTFERIPVKEEPHVNTPNITFSHDFKTSFVLGEYKVENLIVRCCLTSFYEEKEESIGFVFDLGDQAIDTHGILMTEDSSGIFINRDGRAIPLSHRLPDDFIDWMRDLESLTW